MGDMGDYFNENKAFFKQRRLDRAADNVRILKKHGMEWEEKNGGSHFIFKAEGLPTVSFWPSSGIWMAGGKKYSGGSGKMLAWMRRQS